MTKSSCERCGFPLEKTRPVNFNGMTLCPACFVEKCFTKHCKNCGAELPRYPFYSETHEIYHCENCGETTKIKRVQVGGCR